jgi:hypothetical protein
MPRTRNYDLKIKEMAQMEMVAQLARHGDDLGENFNDVRQTIQRVLITRRRTIDMLRNAATTADRIHQGCALSNRSANLTGALGGTVGMVAGGITIASGGLAAPFVIAGITTVGTACSVGGGAWSIKNEIDRGKRNSALQEEISQQLNEDDEALRRMHEIILRIQRGDFGEPSNIFRQLHTFLSGLGGIGMIFGFTAAIDILRMVLPPTAYFLAGGTSAVLLSMIQYLPLIAGKGALEGMDEVAEQSASSAVKFMYNGFSKDFVRREALKAAQKAYKEIFEEVMEKAAKEAAKKAAKEGGGIAAQKAAEEAAKETVKNAAKQTARKAAGNAATKAAKEGAKTAAKMTGAITVAFGAFTSVWEGYNAYNNHYLSQTESQLGSEWRRLADNLEESLNGAA